MTRLRLRILVLFILVTMFGGWSVAPTLAQPSSELVVGFTVDPQTLDARFITSALGGAVLGHVYEPLISTDAQGTLQPKLAERWELRNDRTIRFHLRRNVRFHNGDPLDAAAVKFSIESRIAPDSRSVGRFFLGEIDRVNVVDTHTADILLKSSAARTVLRTLSHWTGYIVPSRFAEQTGAISTAVGTGPYRMVEYRAGERFVVEANRQYWGPAPHVNRVVFRVIPEEGTRVAALERGEIDVAYAFPIDQIARFRGSPRAMILSRPTTRLVIFNSRLDRKPLDDVRVRQAIAHAINATEINRRLLGNRGRVANSVIAPAVFGYSRTAKVPAYDPKRARDLLRAAGQTSFRLRMGISSGRFVSDRAIGEAIASALQDVGTTVDLEAPEFGVLSREVNSPNNRYDAVVWSWATNTLDADFTITPVFHARRSGPYTMYRNNDVSDLIDKARATLDEKEALSLYARIQDTLNTDLPWIPVVYVPDVIGVNRKVEGVQLRADELLFFWNVKKQ